ncbi:hypothetical protein DFH09DRAFT_1336232 [Mycena vulgaris]|nr:hypothetical protein DFH09DRAFT_1336232 [Mycena vulgaris]
MPSLVVSLLPKLKNAPMCSPVSNRVTPLRHHHGLRRRSLRDVAPSPPITLAATWPRPSLVKLVIVVEERALSPTYGEAAPHARSPTGRYREKASSACTSRSPAAALTRHPLPQLARLTTASYAEASSSLSDRYFLRRAFECGPPSCPPRDLADSSSAARAFTDGRLLREGVLMMYAPLPRWRALLPTVSSFAAPSTTGAWSTTTLPPRADDGGFRDELVEADGRPVLLCPHPPADALVRSLPTVSSFAASSTAGARPTTTLPSARTLTLAALLEPRYSPNPRPSSPPIADADTVAAGEVGVGMWRVNVERECEEERIGLDIVLYAPVSSNATCTLVERAHPQRGVLPLNSPARWAGCGLYPLWHLRRVLLGVKALGRGGRRRGGRGRQDGDAVIGDDEIESGPLVPVDVDVVECGPAHPEVHVPRRKELEVPAPSLLALALVRDATTHLYIPSRPAWMYSFRSRRAQDGHLRRRYCQDWIRDKGGRRTHALCDLTAPAVRVSPKGVGARIVYLGHVISMRRRCGFVVRGDSSTRYSPAGARLGHRRRDTAAHRRSARGGRWLEYPQSLALCRGTGASAVSGDVEEVGGPVALLVN